MKKQIFTIATFSVVLLICLPAARQANQKPVANADTVVMSRTCNPAHINLLANDSDADGNELKVTRYSIGGTWYNLTASERDLDSIKISLSSDGHCYIRSKSGYMRAGLTVTYTISDGHRGTATGELYIRPQPLPGITSNGWLVNITTYSDVIITYSMGITLEAPFAEYTPTGRATVTKDGLFVFRPLTGIKGKSVVYVNGYKFIIEVR